MTELKNLIVQMLTVSPTAAKDLVKRINCGSDRVPTTKQKVNSALYDLLKNNKVTRIDSTPPLWVHNPKELAMGDSRALEEDSVQTLIFIDTTNSACHQEAVKYADHDHLIWLYSKELAPPWNVEESEYVKLQPLLQSNETISTAMILDIALFSGYHWGGNKFSLHIIIVSKSSAFQGFDKMLEDRLRSSKYPCQADIIVDGWDSLKLLLE